MNASNTALASNTSHYAVGHVAMHRLLDTAPYLARCSDNKTASLIRPRHYAIRWPYMQVNRPSMVSWLIFDIDHPNPDIWEDNNLPAPNFIVRDKRKNTAHLYYAIIPVCTSDKGRSKPIQFMKRVYKAMAKKMNADLSYAGTVAKTPHHQDWLTTELHGHEYELSELADYVDIEYVPPWAVKNDFDMEHSRNCTLFEELRHFAYSIVTQAREQSHYEAFKDRLERYAEQRNDFALRGFDSNLNYSEVKATVKSVARWTWDKYIGSECANRGIMNLDTSLSKEERQSLAAQRTHNERKTASAKKVLLATQKLVREHQKVTYSAIAKLCKLTRQTVKKYQSVIDSAVLGQANNVISLAEIFNVNPNVKYAVSDISPLQGSSVDLESMESGSDCSTSPLFYLNKRNSIFDG